MSRDQEVEKLSKRYRKGTIKISTLFTRIRKLYPEKQADNILARLGNGASLEDATYACFNVLGK